MVLQRDAPLKLWGWASPGEKVTVNFNGKSATGTTGSNGKWVITLSAMPTGGPYDMEIDASNHIKITNILIGDVWVCSGQSNMELPMERVKERYPDEVANANYSLIRQFNLPTRYNFNKEEKDVPATVRWAEANTKNILEFTAVGYFFAKELFLQYDVPIGLIKASVGGSPAEAWLSGDGLKAFPKDLAIAQRCKDTAYVDSIKKADNAMTNNWNNHLNGIDKGLHGAKPWFDTAYDASAWPTMPIPGYWADHGLKGINGVVWFRKEITVPQEMAGQPAKLMLGRIVDADIAYVNGVQCGTTGYQYPPRRYQVPAGLLKAGKNIITVRVVNNSGRGGFVLDKPYTLSAGGQTIDLRGYWQFQLGAASAPLGSPTFFQYKPEGLYNSMVSPLLNYRIKGVIWYQGEANAYNPHAYAKLFPAMIGDWRKHWQQGNFPFLYVQLANFMETKEQPSESNWAALRDVQRRTLSVANTGMAVIDDIGEWNDIHPLDKEDVGKRLALSAQKVAYGNDTVVYSGPLYAGMKTEGNKITIRFKNTGSGLMAKGGGELKYFSIAGIDKKFVWATAKIEGDKVVVWSDAIAHPVTVRYAWADNPLGANLYNKEGLPASPFTTDDK
jgi:sialate O-acetylesterase